MSTLFKLVQELAKPAVYYDDNQFCFNKATENFIGYTNKEISDIKTWFEKLYLINSEEAYKHYQKSKSANFKESSDAILTNKSGSLIYAKFTGYRQGGEVMWLLTDTTDNTLAKDASDAELKLKMDAILEIKRLKTKLSKENIKLKKSNQELEDFAYVASHDLKEPLRKIVSFSARLKTKYGEVLDEKGVFYIERLENAGMRMQRLIDDLLTYSKVSRIEIDQLKPIDMVDLFNHIEYKLEKVIQDSQAIITKKNILPMHGNDSLLVSLFQNLISNSIKFQRQGVSPEIEIDSQHIEIRNRNYIQYTVKDNGIGIEAKFVKKVFNIFERLHSKDTYKGTGIGLAISKRIVEKHNGKISIDSEVGKGTTFNIYIPKIKQ